MFCFVSFLFQKKFIIIICVIIAVSLLVLIIGLSVGLWVSYCINVRHKCINWFWRRIKAVTASLECYYWAVSCLFVMIVGWYGYGKWILHVTASIILKLVNSEDFYSEMGVCGVSFHPIKSVIALDVMWTFLIRIMWYRWREFISRISYVYELRCRFFCTEYKN